MLLGIWKNYQELEESISLDELQRILKAHQEKEYRMMKFQAAVQGISLDDAGDSAQERFEAIKRRVEAREAGVSEEAAELDEIFGLELEIEE